jgi:dTDP-4-amino-4,6-dideoxygalactose transaminase
MQAVNDTNDTVPFGDLALEVREIRAEVDKAIARVLTRGWFVLGQEGEAFERDFAAFLGAGFAIGCGNGTDAITLALRALGLGSGDEVITVANTCVPTAAGIRDAGCALRLVDCDPITLQMDADALQSAITPSTKAVVPVHLFGSSPDMREIRRICQSAGVPIVEDCAQAHGAQSGGRPAGRWGDLSAWSFYPSKNLGAYGDGGAVVTDDPALADRVRRLRNYGQRVRYYHDEEGRNSRLDELQAAILQVKLRQLDQWNARRRQLAELYTAHLNESPIGIPRVRDDCVSARHLYPIRIANEGRDQIREALKRHGIDAQIHYPVPIHRQKAYLAEFQGHRFPAAEQAAGELLSLPLYPQLADEQVQRVASVLLESLTE